MARVRMRGTGSAPASVASRALIRAVRDMRSAEEREDFETADIVLSGGQCWLGDRRISPATLNEGLRLCLFRSEGVGSSYERHGLNSDGRGLANDPEHYVPQILRLKRS